MFNNIHTKLIDIAIIQRFVTNLEDGYNKFIIIYTFNCVYR